MNVSIEGLAPGPPTRLNAANTPTTTPITVAKKPTRTPRISEFRSK